ncbi:hypothetical protein Clacol_005224 [Clathrus columnatus]|uniref:C2H2-type domain-containing protein n=1 Tax=Clathrus columnatus TaxID=1419009 RepID=A0AAV5A9I5_9AGAM|nr:hypothetical protein Clacol_005224 [Clathrus columnatus]
MGKFYKTNESLLLVNKFSKVEAVTRRILVAVWGFTVPVCPVSDSSIESNSFPVRLSVLEDHPIDDANTQSSSPYIVPRRAEEQTTSTSTSTTTSHMSSHDFGLLSVSPIHGHFQSAFMHGFHHSGYGHDRFPSGPTFERYPHDGGSSSAPRDNNNNMNTYHIERRLSEPIRSNYTLHQQQRQQSSIISSSHLQDYTHTPISQTAVLRRDSSSVIVDPTTNTNTLRSIVDFDPRPPHAGWTPKEEIDEEMQSRELLGNSLSGEPRSPSDMHFGGYITGDPRDESLSPENSASGQPSSPNNSSKTYSFVSLPGNAVRKRPRRRYDEIERLYACSWPDCTKAYGTLNHLNAHVSMQRHGSKRSPAEFKELRKQWRQQKKQESLAGPIRGVDTDPFLRRRRATEPNLAMSRGMLPMSSNQLGMPHRLSLSELQYARSLEEESIALGVSPTSTTSDNVPFWQDHLNSPVEQHQQHQQQHQGSNFYSIAMPSHHTKSSPPLSPHDLVSVSPSMNRLPPDSTLLTPLPGYRPPSPHIRMSPLGNMVQSLPQSTMPSLSPSHQPNTFDDYQDRRLGQ